MLSSAVCTLSGPNELGQQQLFPDLERVPKGQKHKASVFSSWMNSYDLGRALDVFERYCEST